MVLKIQRKQVCVVISPCDLNFNFNIFLIIIFRGTHAYSLIHSSFWRSQGCVDYFQLPLFLIAPFLLWLNQTTELQDLDLFKIQTYHNCVQAPDMQLHLSISSIIESILALFHSIVSYFNRFKNSSSIFNYASLHSVPSSPFSLQYNVLSADRLSI